MEKGFAPTRSKAADLIRLGAVSVGGVAVLKPGAPVAPDACLSISLDASPYVSRGGLKLAAALDAFGLEARGRIAVDVGASTGGFTDVLLARGAAGVFAIDVGRGQLHAKLRADPRVVVLETMDARRLGGAHPGAGDGDRCRCELHQPDPSPAGRARLPRLAPGSWR